MRPKGSRKEGNNKDENRNNEIENRKTDKSRDKSWFSARVNTLTNPSKTDRKKKREKKTNYHY